MGTDFFGDDKDALKFILVKFAQICGYTKNYWSLYGWIVWYVNISSYKADKKDTTIT